MADEVEDLERVFAQATQQVRYIGAQLAADKLLYFYARFKQATEGPCRTPKPGFFDFQGKAKWEAWSKLGDMGKDQAMMEYISLLSNIDDGWLNRLSSEAHMNPDRHPRQQPGQQGMGVSVSVMANTDRVLTDAEKTVFDWCQEGNVPRVTQLLRDSGVDVNCLDQEGLGLLHWACDRGDVEMTRTLLSLGADINNQAKDLQTALHYAVSCEHKDVTELLVQQGIDVKLKDNEGNTAMDIASDDMKLFLHTQLANIT
ncbi:unnamed protein product [Candidula unifasciata]|uniref:Acyl-CoA-binding domain-containing protein 6 n=1 Tax=Candidula unifasciata TaxID=100452 RepID=A0A8S3YGJ4_9EUPU|nr:unnamed protein product [Candidula unifasciata]